MEMKKFTYRNNTEFYGRVLEENETHISIMFVEENGSQDTITLEKELTKVEEVVNEKGEKSYIAGLDYEIMTGFGVHTTKKIYIINRNGSELFRVYKYDTNGRWNRYFDVKKGSLKGSGGLPEVVLDKIRELSK